jgi:CBS domain-containing protein
VSEGESKERVLLQEGIKLRINKQLNAAIEKFDEVLKINPQNATAYREKSIALRRLGKNEEAMAAYRKAMQFDSKSRFNDISGDETEEVKHADKKSRKVSDIMTRNLTTVLLGSSAKKAAELMAAKNISSLAIKDGTNIIGIVTERDFIRKVGEFSGRDYDEIPIDGLVAYPLITMPSDTLLKNAARHMVAKGIRHMIVTDKNEIVGLVSLTDIVKAYLEQ